MGPNIKYLPGEYWDFWDHYVPLSEASLKEALLTRDFGIDVRRQVPAYTMATGAIPGGVPGGISEAAVRLAHLRTAIPGRGNQAAGHWSVTVPDRNLVLVTGASGLIGSEVSSYFARLGRDVHGVDNNQRAVFFGPQGDTRWNQQRLERDLPTFRHHELDIRDRQGVLDLVATLRPGLIVHAAAQPSHDRAADIPFDDFDTNAVGTLNFLEAARRSCPESPFVYLSTNKVYGDGPNRIALTEERTRWDYADPQYANGIPETFSIDQSLHSLFGASKVAADVMVQEYGRYFGMPTCCLQGGCLTGPNHSASSSTAFSATWSGAISRGANTRSSVTRASRSATISIVSTSPVSSRVRRCTSQRGGVRLGGGRANSCSILEAFALVEKSRAGRSGTYVRKRTGSAIISATTAI